MRIKSTQRSLSLVLVPSATAADKEWLFPVAHCQYSAIRVIPQEWQSFHSFAWARNLWISLLFRYGQMLLRGRHCIAGGIGEDGK